MQFHIYKQTRTNTFILTRGEEEIRYMFGMMLFVLTTYQEFGAFEFYDFPDLCIKCDY